MIRPLPQPASTTHYLLAPDDITVGEYLESVCGSPSRIAIDTEDGPDGTWCMTVSGKPGTSILIPTSHSLSVARLQAYIQMSDPVCIIHSALYDLPELASVGVHPRRIHDTMVMAYLLQDEPLGLKPLAWRIANIHMSSYVDTITPARTRKALEYLEFVVSMDWPDPEPFIVWEKGVPRQKSPQGIGPKARRILTDVGKGKRLKDGSLVCPRDRWKKIKEDEGRGMVEEVLGPMPDGYLCDVPIQTALSYACCDADMTLAIYPHLLRRIQELGMEPILDVEMDVTRFVDWMHRAGIPVSREHFASLSRELEVSMEELEVEIGKLSGHTIQLSSHPQVSDLLYNKLGLRRYLPKKRSKKSGATMTGDDILAQIAPHHPVVQKIRDHRKLEKLKNTYADGVPKHIKSDGRVHAECRTTNTDTGRLSMAKPNLMAQPKRNKEWANKIRKGFYAPDGYVILSGDYSQIELRLTAHEAGEESMIRAFREGIDLHSLTASEMFDVSIDEVNKLTQRLPAKTINFGIIYGISSKGLYRNMVVIEGCEHWTEGLAQSYIDKYFERRPGIRQYISDTVAMARRYGRVWDWMGRIRRIPGSRLKNEYYRAEAERQACNARIQMGAQSIIKCAMAELLPVYQGWVDEGWGVAPAIQIHDDIVSIVEEDMLPLIVPVQKQIMEGVKELKTGVKVDFEYGRTWGEMTKWED